MQIKNKILHEYEMDEETKKKRRKEETNFGIRCDACDSGNSKFMWSDLSLHADLFKCLDCGCLFYKN